MCKFLYYTMVSKYSGGGTCPTSTSTSFGSTINSYFFWIVDDQYRFSSGCAVKDDWYQQFLDAIAENYRRIVVPVRLPRTSQMFNTGSLPTRGKKTGIKLENWDFR